MIDYEPGQEDTIRATYEARLIHNLRSGRAEAVEEALAYTALSLGITDVAVMACTSPPYHAGLQRKGIGL